jgi:DNA-binding transcriptional regulator YiaG
MATKPPHPVVTRLKAWRTHNSLSQSQAVRVLVEAGLPVALTTLQQWEIARYSPRPLMVAALGRFLVEQEKLSTKSEKKPIAPVIERLKAWREANNLSQSQTVEVLIAAGLPAKLRTLQDWETGRRSPRGLSTSALERFLNEYPRGITHPFSNRTPPPQSAGHHSSDSE